MDLSYQLEGFITYIIIGNILCLILDVFRGYRKFKKVNKNVVLLQDIIYFILVCIIIIFVNIFILQKEFRLYFIFGFIIGMSIYLYIFSKIVIKYVVKFFNISSYIIEFILLPFDIIKQILVKIYNFFNKIIQKACKIAKNVISYIIIRFNIRGFKYEKKEKGKKKSNWNNDII